MDSSAPLDYALFQLTPTRTRCDIVVVSGGKSEKLASGLVETFISHLKFAKDQIPKGGYSITLRPPFPNTAWFTKPTFQRFVRFVSTPEILERFVQIEQEILQIETSVQSNEVSNTNTAGHDGECCASAANEIIKKSTNSSKSNCEVERADGAALEETSKCRLQRLLNARKALLRKEQAMAYARASVAGFEMDFLDNLICFAEAFGASRLRKACLDFKELHKQKHTDGQWMEELAAMKACSLQESSYLGTSGIILAYENSASIHSKHVNFKNAGVSTNTVVSNGTSDTSSDITQSPPRSDDNRDNDQATTVQIPLTAANIQWQMPLPNQISPFMFHSQNPNSPSLQGYPFPNVHPLQPFYPEHVLWPQTVGNHTNGNIQESNNHRHKRSSRKKEKSSHMEGPEASEDDEESESNESDSGANSDTIGKQDRDHSSMDNPHVKRHKKKSSKTVVIRNINYITSNRRNGDKCGFSEDSSSDEVLKGDSTRREVDDAVRSFKKHLPSKVLDTKNSSHLAQNGSNGYADQDFTHNLAGKVSEGEEKNDNWSAFQNILRSHEESTPDWVAPLQPANFHGEHLLIKTSDNEIPINIRESVNLEPQNHKMQSLASDDSIHLTYSSAGGEDTLNSVDFSHGDYLCPSMKKTDYDEEPLVSERLEESGRNSLATPSDFLSEASVTKNTKEEDWFVANHSRNTEIKEAKQIIFDNNYTISSGGDSVLIETSKSSAGMDDSFMVQSRAEVDHHCGFQLRTDISTVVDWSIANHENGNANIAESRVGTSVVNGPDDLCMVLARESREESTGTSWTPEIMDYSIKIVEKEIDEGSNVVETKSQTKDKLAVNDKSTNTRRNSGPTVKKNSMRDTNSGLLQGLVAKSKKTHPTSRLMVQKSKLEMEEEVFKRMEELAIQRQKRIAERTAAGGLIRAASKRSPGGIKPATSKLENRRLH